MKPGVPSAGQWEAGLRARLRSVPYLSRLDAEALADVQARLRPVRLERGEAALLEGQASDRLYLVARGRLKLLRTSPGGREHILRLLRPGDTFNEVTVFDGGPAPATAEALEPVLLYYWRRQDVLQLMARYPALTEGVTRYLATQLRQLVAMVEDLSFKHVSARLAKLLLEQAGRGHDRGGTALRERLTQQDMAAMIGTAREVVARTLRDMEQRGSIRIEGRRIIITNPKLLEEMA